MAPKRDSLVRNLQLIDKMIPGDDEPNIWTFMLHFCVGLLQLFVENTVELLQTPNTLPEHLKCLPGIKMFTDWIVCNTIGMMGSLTVIKINKIQNK